MHKTFRPLSGVSRRVRSVICRSIALTTVIFVLPLSALALPADEGENKMFADDIPGIGTSDPESTSLGADDDERSILFDILFYIPNRALDLLDIVRLRGRIGPGVAAGFRATKVVSGFAGAYSALYVGLPGPRSRKTPRSPIGLESLNGAQLSLLNASTGFTVGPEYSRTEFGVSAHGLIGGVDVGVDPVEFLDFAAGLFLIDLRDDDL